MEAPILSALILWTGLKPDLSEAPWHQIGTLKALWYQHVSSNAWLIQSFVYFWSQIISLGNSHLSDFQLIYMSHAEAGLYILSETILIPI